MPIQRYLLILFVGLLYLLGFGGLSLLRQQGLSLRFAIEGLTITALGTLAALASLPLSPILFILILYVVTMRVRLLIDLGNWFMSRRQLQRAIGLYHLGLRLWPDPVSRLMVLINMGVARLRMREPEAAYQILEEIMSQETVRVGAKYLAAGYYNLGLACRRTQREAEAIQRFNQAIDVWPNSLHALAAQKALKERPEDRERGESMRPSQPE
jgi:tetratricopeptide (TPR) repeat protein